MVIKKAGDPFGTARSIWNIILRTCSLIHSAHLEECQYGRHEGVILQSHYLQ